MKRILSIALIALLAVTLLAGCGAKEAELKFGTGIHAYYAKTSDADGETNGSGGMTLSAAAVLLDAEGKIVKCKIDAADNTVYFTSEGKAVEAGEFKTKYELGKNYNMAAYGKDDVNKDGKILEWYEQIDAFTKLVEGKTLTEVKALVAESNRGTDEVQKAGCTIYIADYVKALTIAMENAVESKATAKSTLKLAVQTSASGKDVTEEKDGSNEVSSTVVAAALDAEGKVIVADTDVASATFTFDAKGKSTLGDQVAITTKKTAGDDYKMATYGKNQDLNGDGKVLEWYQQAAAFNAALVGKDAKGVAELAVETGYGAESLQTAGCTIHVGDMVKAAVKAATVA